MTRTSSNTVSMPPDVLRPGLRESVPEIGADLVRKGSGMPSYTGKGVIVGIVDSGIDIFHNCFRNPDNQRQSRVLSIWDQTLTIAGKNPPSGFTDGVEFTALDIDNALIHNPDGELIPNDPLAFPHKDTTGHGTHVAGIAAGNGVQPGNCKGANTFIGVAPEASLVVVKVDGQRSVGGVLVESWQTIVDAVRHIFLTAKGKPAVANISLHFENGAIPDGTSPLDKGLDALLDFTLVLPGDYDPTNKAIVTIAGNHRNAGTHALESVAANGTFTRRFTALHPEPHCFVWFSGGGIVEISIETSKRVVGPVRILDAEHTDAAAGDDTVTITPNKDPTDLRNNFDVKINTHAPINDAINKTWTLKVKAGTAPIQVECWAVASTLRFKYGTKQFHPDPGDAAGKQIEDRDNEATITSPGSASNVITVGSYDRAGNLEENSGRGPLAGARKTPDVCAPGFKIVAPLSGDRLDEHDKTSVTAERSSRWCCDLCYDFYFDDTGTSMAAPHVTGVVALMLQRNPHRTFQQIRESLRKTARKQTPTVPDLTWGMGKVSAREAVLDTPLPAGGGGGVGGGGGGGDQFVEEPMVLPFAAEIGTYLPGPARVAAILHQFADSATGQLVAALVSTHFDEVRRLVDRNRRVATMWHRMNGPLLMRALATTDEDGAAFRAALGHVPGEPTRRMLTLLSRYGTSSLRQDLAAHGPLFLDVLVGRPAPVAV